MSVTSIQDRLKIAIMTSGETWLPESPEAVQRQLLDQIAQEIGAFQTEYKKRFGDEPDPFGLLATDPLMGRAFFQMDTLRTSVEIKIMVWRLLLGCEFRRIHFDYDSDGKTVLTFALKTPYGEEEHYRGEPFRDFGVLRHLGMYATVPDNQFRVQGYYAFK
ncbi:MAG: hypothetical protein ABI353_09775 [Isosphaeraceae bacterium]